jgi:putative hydroxymethylpyrimidine transport system substrate-binding protein
MKRIKILYSVISLFFLLVNQAHSETAPQKLTLVLDWFVNPDHATLFVAEDQGFFKEQNLEVKLISPADSSDPPKWVAAGQADLAITYEPDFIDQVEQGLPLIAIGTLVDQPLNCLLLLKDGPVKTLTDLKNKRIGSSSGGIKSLMLQTMLKKQGLQLKDIELINVRHNLMQALLARKVDAVSGAMRNIEAAQLASYGHEPLIFLPEKNGIPSYSELIFVTQKKNLDQPEKRLAIRHFLLALKKATAYLRKHPEACWQAFSKKYPALKNDLNRRAWDASLPLFASHPEKISAEEWRAFITFMRQNGLIQSKHSLTDYLTEI